MRRAAVRRARHWIANRGWTGAGAEVWRRLRLWARGQSQGSAGNVTERRTENDDPVHPFDLQHGVDTGGLIWGEDLQFGDAEARSAGPASSYWTTGYYAVAPSVFWQVLDRLALPWPEYTFVDIGCGKGRALLLATRYAFRGVLGMELAPELARAAVENVARFSAAWRRGDVPVGVTTGDAVHLPLPAGPLLVYLYHPFAAPVMTRLLARLCAAVQEQRRDILLLYVNPELDALLRRTACLEHLWSECFAMNEEDQRADRFGSAWERMVLYRVRTAA